MQNQGKDFSRRKFLQGSLGGLVTIGLLGAATGCSQSASVSSSDASSGAAAAPSVVNNSKLTEARYEVYDTDLLIVGCGYGGLSAAYQAAAQGVQTIVVDKGPYNGGGVAGMNFDFLVATATGPMGYVASGMSGSLKNEALKFKAYAEDSIYMHLNTLAANHGQGMVARNEDGTIKAHNEIPDASLKMVEQNFPRHELDELRRKPTVQISDRTMITDLIVKDGVCYGAMGYYLPTGTFRVYRAKAVVSATGGCCWMHGWNTVAPQSGNVPDNTADVDMAALRHGAAITEAEFCDYDLLSIYPTGIACGYPAGLGADGMNINYIYDADGVAFMCDPKYDPVEFLQDRSLLNRTIGQTILNGKGSEHGGVYVDFSDPAMQDSIRYFYRRNIQLYKDVFGIDVTADKIECAVEMLEHGGSFVVDENAMCEDIQGLFSTRGGGSLGTQGDPGASGNIVMGTYAAKQAIQYAKDHDYAAGFDWTLVEDEYQRIHEIRTRQAQGGKSPTEIRRAIQEIGGKCLGVIRQTADLESGLAELQRIRREDLPRQVLRDDSCVYNTEWKEAIENINLLSITEISVQATLLREESRGAYFRPDFPGIDDEKWNCMLYCRQKDGELEFATREFAAADWMSYDWTSKV